MHIVDSTEKCTFTLFPLAAELCIILCSCCCWFTLIKHYFCLCEKALNITQNIGSILVPSSFMQLPIYDSLIIFSLNFTQFSLSLCTMQETSINGDVILSYPDAQGDIEKLKSACLHTYCCVGLKTIR